MYDSFSFVVRTLNFYSIKLNLTRMSGCYYIFLIYLDASVIYKCKAKR